MYFRSIISINLQGMLWSGVLLVRNGQRPQNPAVCYLDLVSSIPSSQRVLIMASGEALVGAYRVLECRGVVSCPCHLTMVITRSHPTF